METTTADAGSPQLAAPGAGLPLPELWIARFRFRLMRRKMSREDIGVLFEAERARVLDLARSVPDGHASQPVLIKRLRGLEDSSRNWSIWMTLDHLRIVNGAILATVRGLGRGEVPQRVVSTADVKPSPDITGAVVGDFDRSCGLLLRAVAAIDDLRTPARHPHPWFGSLDASGWYALAAMHQRIHRGQIERILASLPAA